jgi:hypothetical protein
MTDITLSFESRLHQAKTRGEREILRELDEVERSLRD